MAQWLICSKYRGDGLSTCVNPPHHIVYIQCLPKAHLQMVKSNYSFSHIMVRGLMVHPLYQFKICLHRLNFRSKITLILVQLSISPLLVQLYVGRIEIIDREKHRFSDRFTTMESTTYITLLNQIQDKQPQLSGKTGSVTSVPEWLTKCNREFPSDQNHNREFFIQLIQKGYLIHYDKFYLTNVLKNLLLTLY